MKTKDEHFINSSSTPLCERGNALVYVLIAIVLFSALSFTLSRQSGTDEASDLDRQKAKFYATQMIGYATQTKSAIDQLLFMGTEVADLDFTLPSDPTFNTAPHLDKVFHPEGGGLNLATLSSAAIDQNITDPVAGWYLGRFNNVDWTPTAGDDVILIAYQIRREICQQINFAITGSIVIPTMGDSIKEVMIDDSLYTGTNTELTTDTGEICPECRNVSNLCVENQAQDAYGFYTVISDRDVF